MISKNCVPSAVLILRAAAVEQNAKNSALKKMNALAACKTLGRSPFGSQTRALDASEHSMAALPTVAVQDKAAQSCTQLARRCAECERCASRARDSNVARGSPRTHSTPALGTARSQGRSLNIAMEVAPAEEPWRRGLFDDDDSWEAPATPPRPPPAPVETTGDAPSKALRALALSLIHI